MYFEVTFSGRFSPLLLTDFRFFSKSLFQYKTCILFIVFAISDNGVIRCVAPLPLSKFLDPSLFSHNQWRRSVCNIGEDIEIETRRADSGVGFSGRGQPAPSPPANGSGERF